MGTTVRSLILRSFTLQGKRSVPKMSTETKVHVSGDHPKHQNTSKTYGTTDPRIKYCARLSIRNTPVQEKLIQETLKHRKSGMLGSTDELQLLANLCKMIGAKKTIDVGVFTGYSSLTIAQVLPEDGKVIALDVNDDFASVGKPFWKEAGVDKKIDLRIGPAVESMQKLLDDGEEGTVDFIFIDADKLNYDNYYELGLKLLRPGGFLAIDNTLWDGMVYNPEVNDEETVYIRTLNEKIGSDTRVDTNLLNIGDGCTLVFKPR